MATWISIKPNLVLTPFTANPILPRTKIFDAFSHHNYQPFLRGSLPVARFGFKTGLFPTTETLIKDLFGTAETVLYTIADAALSNSDSITSTKQDTDWLSGVTNSMETVLKVLKNGLSTLHVPYAYGFAIILLTVLVKAATFPLTKKQVESAMAMRSLQPQIKAIQQRYAGDQERIQLETARLYKLAGINPLAGCLPTLATIPVWIGLYRALSNVADEGLLTEGFFWIPSLAGPTTIASRQNGSGISWLFPFIDGHPPLGWSDTLAYLVLPLLLVVTQYISVQIMQSSQNNDPNMKSSQVLTKVLPLMIGYFALSVPSGLSLYWFTNNILSTAQQVWLQKLGGAKIPVKQFGDDMIKEDELRIQKSTTQLSSSRKKAGEGDKLTSEGLQPGERFKQLKEEEARRRREREEEKRKAENAAGGNLVNGINGQLTSVTTISHSSNGGVVNGDLSSQERREKSEVSANLGVDGGDEKQSNKDIKSIQ
ncbi:60KD_IMP domain-containing protein [Cephalotus follicularis]|uniref:60KD_IMP domain-containing protein n=1 Tax=Cephalotus follicularis TaxID=3775 RepID=A0A1Q3AVQ2_CEPFO|nr:60KD_IMP domain-containing protein [Cephalotus follicularis]